MRNPAVYNVGPGDPFSRAWMQHSTLGIIPPLIIPASIRSGISDTRMLEIRLAGSSGSAIPRDIGQDQLVGLQRHRDLAGNMVGVDVVRSCHHTRYR